MHMDVMTNIMTGMALMLSPIYRTFSDSNSAKVDEVILSAVSMDLTEWTLKKRRCEPRIETSLARREFVVSRSGVLVSWGYPTNVHRIPPGVC